MLEESIRKPEWLMRVGLEVLFYGFQQDLSPSLNFSLPKLPVSLLPKELISNVNGGQNSQFSGGACSGFLSKSYFLYQTLSAKG
jgi:hypothetical protein